ncbi:hypothetical protein [Kushneria phosphatilytica]|uniref:Uncharacterized protein n=1 Tax=Kushneria phosphatilytica TaxID=657387 RepID=A0A1S1NRR9_9GAMM|nr:hypothetical protein [Kushneria phosphatilytica]OHV08704.1 hypothetical protein BH688_11780 [Kushneria phosphatilytica]QEL12423.1 hypothetical protein FY550_15600 [Kushneria phosphatilytica]
MLDTAMSHFADDIARARGLLDHAKQQASGTVKDDIFRASWMMGVGACDAYFSDAYADLVAKAIQAKEIESSIEIPDRLNNLKLPVTAMLRQANGGWRWRMAARELIEEENVLSLGKIQQLFNHFFRKEHKLLNAEAIGSWITHPESKQRVFGITATNYRKLNSSQKGKARKEALDKVKERYETIFQRRHDCIHNCDRPKILPLPISEASVKKSIQDVEFLVNRCHEAIKSEFPIYLTDLGFSAVTKNRVGV